MKMRHLLMEIVEHIQTNISNFFLEKNLFLNIFKSQKMSNALKKALWSSRDYAYNISELRHFEQII